jgi:uncharacterized ferritin-like protein (DUF455 family)
MSGVDTERLDPTLFGERPARDARFVVKDVWADCLNLVDDHPEKTLEFLHRQLNEEANVLENAARNLAEFPDADWDLRLALARQCADEARHVLLYRCLVERRGGRVGQYPVMNFQYQILGRIGSLIGRLAVENRTFEADGLDAATFGLAEARRAGDSELATILEAQQADEIFHVGFANAWIRREVKRNPRSALEMARALTQGSRAFAIVFAGGGTDVTKYDVAERERLEAGFAPDEVRVAIGLSEARRADVLARRAGDDR